MFIMTAKYRVVFVLRLGAGTGAPGRGGGIVDREKEGESTQSECFQVQDGAGRQDQRASGKKRKAVCADSGIFLDPRFL